MPAEQQTTRPKPAAEESVVAWFLTLERAREDNDFARAAAAAKKLQQLGVQVKYLPQKRREVAAHA
jgi:hypothetical protein